MYLFSDRREIIMGVKEFGKNLLIAFLMILAVYQTAELWFGNFSSHNFFSFVFNTEIGSQTDIEYTMKRMLINTGDGHIVCRANDVYGSDYKAEFDSLISDLLSKGSMTEDAGSIDWKSVLENRCVIYEYNFVLTGDVLKNAFGVRRGNVEKIKYCNRIILSPKSDGSGASVMFYNTRDDSIYKITGSKKKSLIQNCNNLITSFASDDMELNYISSEKNNFDIFRYNTFIPQWQGETYTYDRIRSKMTVSESCTAEENADVFFDNPVAKWTSEDENGNLVFSDENSVIKYYDEGVLEYNNYKASGSGDDTFTENYNAACALIKKDVFVKNSYFLRSYSNQNGKYVFGFDYRVNDTVINMSSELKSKTGLNSAIEVTVSDGRVSKYRRYACNYVVDETSDYAVVDFVTAADNLYAELGIENPVENMELAFVDDGQSTELRWIIDIDGKEYVRNVREK
jgi:hypothetical protein